MYKVTVNIPEAGIYKTSKFRDQRQARNQYKRAIKAVQSSKNFTAIVRFK